MKNSGKTNIPTLRKKKVLTLAEPYLFLLPALVIFGLFLYYPFLRTIFLSMFLTNKTGKPKIFVLFTDNNNYLTLFKDPSFWSSVSVTFKFVILVALGGLLVGLTSSLLTERKYLGSSFSAAVYAMPIAIASAAASMAFKMILHPTNGLLNQLMGTQINFTGDSRYALASVVGITIWLTSGINFIFIRFIFIIFKSFNF